MARRAGARPTASAPAFSWLIEEGHAGGTDLTGLAVTLAIRYDDDDPGSPWSWILYLDERANAEQDAALEEIFTGRLGGDALAHFPWAWKENNFLGVRKVSIELDHTRRREWLRIRDRVTVRIRDRFPGTEAVTCVIPGHDRDGEELIADELRVDDPELSFVFSGVCGYAATFDYSG